MKLPDMVETGNRYDLAKYRVQAAEEDLHSAELLYDNLSYRGANNRAYYSVFQAISAVLAMDSVGFKRHKDVIAYFNKNYVAEGKFPKEIGRQIKKAEEIRQRSDYDAFYIASKEITKQQIETAKKLIEYVKDYCEINI